MMLARLVGAAGGEFVPGDPLLDTDEWWWEALAFVAAKDFRDKEVPVGKSEAKFTGECLRADGIRCVANQVLS